MNIDTVDLKFRQYLRFLKRWIESYFVVAIPPQFSREKAIRRIHALRDIYTPYWC